MSTGRHWNEADSKLSDSEWLKANFNHPDGLEGVTVYAIPYDDRVSQKRIAHGLYILAQRKSGQVHFSTADNVYGEFATQDECDKAVATVEGNMTSAGLTCVVNPMRPLPIIKKWLDDGSLPMCMFDRLAVEEIFSRKMQKDAEKASNKNTEGQL